MTRRSAACWGRGLELGFDLKTLRQVEANKPYLQDAPISYIYLCHIIMADRQIFALFMTSSAQAYFIVQNRPREDQGLPNIDKMYDELFQKRTDEAGRVEYQPALKFKTTTVSSRKKAYAEVSDAIKKLRAEEKERAVVLVVQSQQVNMLCHDIPIMKEIPILPLKHDENDTRLPPLGWHTAAARRIISHYFGLGTWISHMLELSRYGNIPICNLDGNRRAVLDRTLRTRARLQREHVVLWWSRGPQPDHAGYEKDSMLRQLEEVQHALRVLPGPVLRQCASTSTSATWRSTRDPRLGAPQRSRGIDLDCVQPGSRRRLRRRRHSLGQRVCDSGHHGAARDGQVVVGRGGGRRRHGRRARAAPHALGRDAGLAFLYDAALHHYVRVMSRKALQQLMSDFPAASARTSCTPARTGCCCRRTGKTEGRQRVRVQPVHPQDGQGEARLHVPRPRHPRVLGLLLVWYDAHNYGGRGCEEVVEAEDQTLDTLS